MVKALLNKLKGENFNMKNFILAVFIFLALFVTSLTINTGTVSASNVLDNPYYEVVVQTQHLIITYELDGPGGRIVNVMIEHID